MNAELNGGFEELEYVSTTADIWTGHNKSYLGVSPLDTSTQHGTKECSPGMQI